MPSVIMLVYEWMFALFAIPSIHVYRLFFWIILKLCYLISYIRTMKHGWLWYMEGWSFIIQFVMHTIKTKPKREHQIVEQLLSAVGCFPSSMGCRTHFMFKTFLPVVEEYVASLSCRGFHRRSCNFHSSAILMEWLWTKICRVNMKSLFSHFNFFEDSRMPSKTQLLTVALLRMKKIQSFA